MPRTSLDSIQNKTINRVLQKKKFNLQQHQKTIINKVVNELKNQKPLLNFHHKAKRKWQNGTVEENVFKVELNKDYNGVLAKDVTEKLYSSFRKLVKYVKSTSQPQNLVRVQIDHPSLMRAILVPLQKIKTFDQNQIMGNIERVLQSNDKLALGENFNINVGIVNIPQGKGQYYITNIKNARIQKRSICAINNADEYCFARATAVGIAYLRDRTNYSMLKTEKRQIIQAKWLHEIANVKPPVYLDDIPKFEQALRINIVVFSAKSGNKVTYANLVFRDTIYLWMHSSHYNENHFDLILKPHTFLNKKHFCCNCLKGFDKFTQHKCKTSCFCQWTNCTFKQNTKCSDCNRICKSPQCYKRHKQKRKKAPSVCETSVLCTTCKLEYKRTTDHSCGTWRCNNCKRNVKGLHECYIRGHIPKTAASYYIDFDFETDQSSGQHIPNFVVAYKSCPECSETPTLKNNYCECCGEREFISYGLETLHKFGSWVFTKEHKGYTIRSHNGSGYDNTFVLEYLLSQGIVPDIIYNGTKFCTCMLKKV